MAVNTCGLIALESRKEFLPLVDIEAHTTILATISRTKLIQTYHNPSENRTIPELQYTFPLYDGVSVVGFSYRIGDQTIVGQVKEREKARNDFKNAVAQGEKAALLEQLLDASDVFTATVGNVPPGTTIVVEITYIGECKHDAEVDGIRFTIPTTIMPRYGEYPVGLIMGSDIESVSGGRIQITIDVIMAHDSVIQQIQSPSHPIVVSLGTTSFAPDAKQTMSKASATLSLCSVELNKDFIVQVVAKDTGAPTAILETHPTILNQRALMATLVPTFVLPPEKPEIVFMCDRSGSMDGSNITLLRSAMRVFLKSLPVGVMFNICSFGSSLSFLWDKSQTYTLVTLEEALKHVDTIDADMGGTEMFEAIEETFDRRSKDIPLEVLLLTDGAIWEHQRLFSYLNMQVIESHAPIRVFTLGIGNGVSHALIEGVAKAGNGFSQSVGEGERMESKVVHILEGALSPHIVDYTLEVKYADEHRKVDIGDDDFDVVERVTDSLSIKLGLTDNQEAKFGSSLKDQEEDGKPTSLIYTSVDPDSGVGKYTDLPLITPPKLLQVPNTIPPLYAFSRTNVYLLMDPGCSQMTPKSVVLRGTSRHGPLEIEIPIQILDTPGEIIHQLAAKKAMVELEQGRGWITQATDEHGVSIQSKFESLFSRLVEREAVRLGVQFQVQGKWNSFVAVKSKLRRDVEEAIRIMQENINMDETRSALHPADVMNLQATHDLTLQPACDMRTPWFRRVVAGASAAVDKVRRRRAREEAFYLIAAGGIGGAGQSEYCAAHGGIPPLVPLAPIEMEDVQVNDFNYSYYPGGPSGSGHGVPPVGAVPYADNSHAGEILGGLAAAGALGAAAHHHKKKEDEREEVSHGHVAPVAVPGGPFDNTTETNTGHGGIVPVPVPIPGGPSSGNSIKQLSGAGGIFPVGSSSSTTTETETMTSGGDHYGRDVLLGAAAVVAGAVGAGVVRHIASSRTDSETLETTRIIPSGASTISSSTRIVSERTETGEIRRVIVGGFSGNAIRVLSERTSNNETRLVPTNEPTGELHHVITERSESGTIRYIIGGIIAGGLIRDVTERTQSGGARIIPGGVTSVTSSTRIVTERTSTGEIRYVIIGGFSGNAIRVLTERTSNGETRVIPTNEETAELRIVITERTESGEIRYIIGGIITGTTITRVVMGPRIVTERTSTGEILYAIVDQYNGKAIRTKFERNEETGEFVHLPVKEPEGELRYVTEERTETGEIRKVIGAVITGNVTASTRIVSGGLIPEGTSTSTQTRIVAERNESGETRYYQFTNGPDGQKIRTMVERTEDGGFRILGGATIVGAGATLVENSHQTTTTTRVVGGGALTSVEQAANKTQITPKLSITRYERADVSAAIPNAANGTVMFSKFKMLAPGDVNLEDTAYSHVKETKAPQARRTIKWMKIEAHWKLEANMLQHLKSDRYIADLYTLFSLPEFAEYRYVSILGSFSCDLESYMQAEQLSSIQIRQLTASLSDALRWCHERHVVHLNVRPASFYLAGVGQDVNSGNGQLGWKLWNFGHARFVGETVDTSATTVTYAAPEILKGRKKSDATVLSAVSMDRWSLGLIIYELHACRSYFSSSNFAEFQLTNEEGTQFVPGLDAVREEDARRAIRGLLEVDAKKRYTHETLREVYFGREQVPGTI